MTIYNSISRFIVASLLGLVAMLTSCDDRLPYNAPDAPTEGESEVTFEMSFKDFTPQLHSRANGQSIQSIDNAWLFIFNAEDGSPLEDTDHGINFPIQLNISGTTQDGLLSDYTAIARLKLLAGKYRMYIVANETQNVFKYRNERALLSGKVVWDNETTVGGNGISPNAQMFGVVTTAENPDEAGQVMYADPDDDNNLISAPKGENIKYPYDVEYKLAPVVTLGNKSTDKLHAWLRRCASKITVAFDGTNLYDDVTISIMSATIKDIPARCTLGIDNKVTAEDNFSSEGETLYYYDNSAIPSDQWTMDNIFLSGLRVSNDGVFEYNNPNALKIEDFHDKSAKSLFFFENMQGEGRNKEQNLDPDRDIDQDPYKLEYVGKDDKPYGTYLEVEALYQSNNENRPSKGMIIYRFMLGQNTTTDYNATRNTHYKLTLCFKGWGNEIDWHIDYGKPFLRASNPAIFDYQGKVFVPDSEVPNLDHNFTADNTVLVSCYTEDAYMNKNDRPWKVEYSQDGNTWSETDPGWLELLRDEDIKMGPLPYQRYVTFRVDQSKIVNTTFQMKDKLEAEKGSREAPINLADPNRSVAIIGSDPALITSTANCYMIKGPGWYILPLIYGNAITNGNDIKNSYTGTGSADPASDKSGNLGAFLNHKGNRITTPYIEDYGTPKDAYLIWQDVQTMIPYLVWRNAWNIEDDSQRKRLEELNLKIYGNNEIEYVKDAYEHNGKKVGGIRFHVVTKEEGNAVIGISEQSAEGKNMTDDNLPPSMWSWHIWMTNPDAFSIEGYPADKNIEVTAYPEQGREHIYNMMPMNLGWCSDNKDITYYPERTCYIRFSSGNDVTPQILTVVQKSHIALPMGNNPYYQWGRKDPFVGGASKTTIEPHPLADRSFLAKAYYFQYGGWGQWSIPSSTEFNLPAEKDYQNRKTTVKNFAGRIQYPYQWQLPPRLPRIGNIAENDFAALNENKDWKSNDQTYFNLWDTNYDGNLGSDYPTKTIYDPCPVGYQVPSMKVFSGFTTRGQDSSDDKEWFNVKKENINHYNGTQFEASWLYRNSVYEFYTNRQKYQSIVFPVSGYRDWDAHAQIYRLGTIGYCWTATNMRQNPNMSYNLEHSAYGGYDEYSKDDEGNEIKTEIKPFLRPQNPFYPCDGFPIRPVVQENVTIK